MMNYRDWTMGLALLMLIMMIGPVAAESETMDATMTPVPSDSDPASGAEAEDVDPVGLLAGPRHLVAEEQADGRSFTGRMMNNQAMRIEQVIAGLELNAEQDAKVRETFAEFSGQYYAYRRKNSEKLASLRQAATEAEARKDADALREARESIQAIKAAAPSRLTLLKSIREVLTPEQYHNLLTTIRDHRAGNGRIDPAAEIARIVASLDLTDDQRSAVDQRLTQHRAAEAAFVEKHLDALTQFRERILAAELANQRYAARQPNAKLRQLYQKHGPDPRQMVREVAALLPPSARMTYWQEVAAVMQQFDGNGQQASTRAKPRETQLQLTPADSKQTDRSRD